ncbi:MAG: U32 family peptidase [Syntrophomonadaceae bacterium]|nr:U32 family peptidase [Syntrophomonadaceae bacterium]
MPFEELELLAPAGQMDVLRRVVAAGADAVYLGGKRFNMRALKSDFNFTDDEIKYAADFLHQNHRKLYITVNNLYNSQDLDEIAGYLWFLQDAGVDGLIVQDLGIIGLCDRLHLDLPLHASVQMGISNLEAVKVLEARGFRRVILSKNVSLPEIKEISRGTRLGIEYFVHGDLCISHTGQCYMSTFVSGESGNQGKCRKPCRWTYELEGPKNLEYEGYQHFLAHKDLCLYPYLAQMAAAGVSSFKIEGRMRKAEFLAYLVSIYRRALDRLLADPSSYTTDAGELRDLEERRIRDFSAGNLLEPLDRRVVGYDGSREPMAPTTPEFLSKLEFSVPAENIAPVAAPVPELTVRAGGPDRLARLAAAGADNIILGMDQLRQSRQYWTPAALKEAAAVLQGTGSKLYLETPRIVTQNDLAAARDIKSIIASAGIDGMVVNDLGSLNLFKDTGLDLWGGYGLNTFNCNAAAFLQEFGLSRITASLEMNPAGLKMLLEGGAPVEIMVHGPLPGMVSDYCVIRAAQSETGECSQYCMQDEYALIDVRDQKYPIVTDNNCRNYLLLPYDLCLFEHLPRLQAWGAKSLRIDGQCYEPEKLEAIVACYHEALQQMKNGRWEPAISYAGLMGLFPAGLTAALFTGTMPD